MIQHLRFLPCLLLLTVVIFSTLAHAQFDPYARVNEPLSIADLSELQPLKGVCFVGPNGIPQGDGSKLIASDEGKGTISHIWMTVDHSVADSATQVRIVVDDSTILTTTLRGIGRLASNGFHAPFDTTMSGGSVCDVQIPYKKNFKIYYKGPYLFCAIIWRPLPLSADLGSFAEAPYRYEQDQLKADAVYWRKASPWHERPSDSLHQEWDLPVGASTELAALSGPSFIHTLEFFNKADWSEYQDSVYLQIYWNGNPRPSIDLPLTDFFGLGNGATKVESFQIRSSSTHALSYLPMPFEQSARITLVNRSSRSLKIGGRVLWSDLDTAGKDYGLLSTSFKVSAPTKHEVDHEMIDQLGRGRYIGCNVAVRDILFPYFLEGDYQFNVDGSPATSWRYTGTEDYFNGAWYFEDSIFSLPFAGCTIQPSTFYRFHYLDAVDFNDSMKLSCEHGNLSSVRVHYRTASYLYLESQHLWAVSDTIVLGEPLRVQGNALARQASLELLLGDQVIGSALTDSDGDLDAAFDLSLPAGTYRLHTRDHYYDRPVIVLAHPTLSVDTSRKIGPFNYRDKLSITGRGFKPGEEVTFAVDTFSLAGSAVAGSDGTFTFLMSVPHTPSFDREIKAVGSLGSVGSSPVYSWSRTLEFEAELQPFSPGHEISYMDWWGHLWSQSAMPFVYSTEPSTEFNIAFAVPIDDTFRIEIFYTTTIRYGNYEVFVDNEDLGLLVGYADRDYNDPQRTGPLSLGPLAIREGRHVLRFSGRGRDARAVENSLGVDNFRLIPTSAFRADVSRSPQLPGSWVANPSPLRGSCLNLTYTPGGAAFKIPTHMTLRDGLGRQIGKIKNIEVLGTELTPSLKVSLPSIPAGCYYLEIPGSAMIKFVKLAD